MLYINEHVWNLEKWYTRTYVKDRNRNADPEHGHVGTGQGRMNWETEIIYTMYITHTYTAMSKIHS